MLHFTKFICAVFLLFETVTAAREYYGAHLGALSQLHHAVSGDVYAVDSRTLFLKNFNYDGEGPAAFFYVGNTKRPGNQGAIRLRDERGSTGVLKRYRKKDITLSLPEGKTLRDIKWFSVWCDEFSVNFGDVSIPKNFDFPRPYKLGALKGVHGVSSDNIVVVDAQTILIPNFSYDGEAPDAKFWVGHGDKPTPNGVRIPDENGRVTPLTRYDRKTIVLTLPGDLTIFDIGHFGVWCEAFTVDFGHVKIPVNINVPPSLKMLNISPQSKLNCEVLYDDLAFEVRWAVAGESIVIQLVAKLDDGEYMSFGLSPDKSKTFMVGADVAVAWIDKNTGKGYAEDYFLDAKAQCSGSRGSCPDTRLGDKTNSIRVLNAATVNGYSIVTYQRPLRATDEFDLPIISNATQAIAWAIGPLNQRNEVSYHSLYSKTTKLIQFGREPKWNCPLSENDMKMIDDGADEGDEIYDATPNQPINRVQTTSAQTTHRGNYAEIENDRRKQVAPTPARAPSVPRNKHWEIPPIQCYEPDDGVFYAQMGPTGGKQGYPAITGHVGWGISWYINGLLIPEINVVRGKTYTFVTEGGNDPDVPAKYHPFYITDDSVGGYEHKNDEERANVQLFAGIKRNRFGALEPTGVGRLCNWTPDPNGPSADEYSSFGAYQRSLTLICDSGEPGVITWTVGQDTPDTVYYQCFTHRYLGWKINVLDSCDESGSSSTIDEIYVPPDQPEQLQPAQSIRHETKVKPNDIFLLQNERKIDEPVSGNHYYQNHNQHNPHHRKSNGIQQRNDKHNYELTKMIANGILAAEALETSLKTKNNSKHGTEARPLQHHHSEPSDMTEILPMYLTPPKSFIDKPFWHEQRAPFNREKDYLGAPHVSGPPNVRHKHFNGPPPPPPPPSRKNPNNDGQKLTKISMPPLQLRRDYIANNKPVPQFPVNNKPLSLQKHLLRGPPAPYVMKQNHPSKLSKKEAIPFAQNIGFKPDSVVVESGFLPISRRHFDTQQDGDNEFDDVAYDGDDYPEQKHRRSDTVANSGDNGAETEKPELLIKTFEPMFIPSPLDSTITSLKGGKNTTTKSNTTTSTTSNNNNNNNNNNNSKSKKISGDLQYMEMEDGEDKMAMAGERHAYYLPPDVDDKTKSTKTVANDVQRFITYDGRAVLDKSIIDAEPDFPTPNRPSNDLKGLSKTEQLLNTPQFGPFKGDIPPLTSELMKPHILRSQPKSNEEQFN